MCVCVCPQRSRNPVLVQKHSEALEAPGVQVKRVAHQGLVEHAEVTAVLDDGLDRAEALQVHGLNPPQQQADPLLQPVRLLLQAAVDRELLEELKPQKKPSEKAASTRGGAGGGVQYFGPLVMDVHGPQHHVSTRIHPRLVGKHKRVS